MRLFVKRFALCCRSSPVCLSVCPVLSYPVCNFGVLWPSRWMEMKLDMRVDHVPGHIGTQLPSSKGAQPPQISAHVYCDQTAGWIKMPLGVEIGIGPGHIVLAGDPAPAKKGAPPIFGPCLMWPNDWMDQDATVASARATLCLMWTQQTSSEQW